MKIGILECGHTMPEVEAKHGTFPQMFARLLQQGNFTFDSYDVEFMEFPETITECDGWLLTGSKHGAYENHAFIPPLEEFIRNAYAKSIPMVGICFGHQIIAQALGGYVEKFKDGWALGLNDYAFEGLGTLKLNAWHQDQVTRLPDRATPIASNAFCKNAAVAYDTRALTIQPHPEFGGEIISDYADIRRGTGTYPNEMMDRAKDRAAQPDDNHAVAAQIIAFFDQARNAHAQS